jgi:hypothetical protein
VLEAVLFEQQARPVELLVALDSRCRRLRLEVAFGLKVVVQRLSVGPLDDASQTDEVLTRVELAVELDEPASALPGAVRASVLVVEVQSKKVEGCCVPHFEPECYVGQIGCFESNEVVPMNLQELGRLHC